MAPCNCGKNSSSKSATQTFVVTNPNGEKKTYSTEVEAAAAAKRVGGSYRAA